MMKKTFIDRKTFHENILNYMAQLNKFIFDIRPCRYDCNESALPTMRWSGVSFSFMDSEKTYIEKSVSVSSDSSSNISSRLSV